jgi:hypothetical protein
MFSGLLISLTLTDLILVDDSNLILSLACGLGFVWAVVMVACIHLFIQRDRNRSDHAGSAILVNLGNLVLLGVTAWTLEWNLSGLPGQNPDWYFSHRKDRYEQAVAQLPQDLSNPNGNLFLNVMLPMAYRSLSDARGGEVETWVGNNYNGTWHYEAVLFYKSNVISWLLCGTDWIIMYSADDAPPAKSLMDTPNLQHLAPKWFRFSNACPPLVF